MGFKPPRPYVYVRSTHTLTPQLLPKHDNAFWALVEDFYDKILSGSQAAAMSDRVMWDQDTANRGLELLLETGSLGQTMTAVMPNATKLSVH